MISLSVIPIMEKSELISTNRSSWQFGLYFNKQLIQWILCFVTFVFIFIFHTSPLEISDFWWHLNTGRWIWTNGGMPTDDPFLFSSDIPLDARASLILRGYPLSQLIFFGSYTLAGPYALVALQGLLLTLFYGLLWNYFRQHKLHPLLASTIVGLLPILFFRFIDLRPQLFSFIGTLLVMQQIEYILANERRGRPLKPYVLLFLPVTMLLWANLHPGYFIGVGLLFVYLFSEWVARKKGSASLPDDAFWRFLAVVLFSVAITLLNPAGISAISVVFTTVSGPFSKVIDEYWGTLKYFEFYGLKNMGYMVVAAAVLPSLALLLKWRELSIAHMLMVVLFLTAGIMAFRFSLLMVAVILSIACVYFVRDLNRWLSRAKGIPVIILWCVSTWFLANSALNRTALPNSPLGSIIPSSAVDYLAQTKPKGNIYNYFGYGGYLSWRLYPQKIYIDQRGLSWETHEEYLQSWRIDYSEVFHKYQIGVVISPILNLTTRKRSPLVVRLLHDNEWAIAYYDRLNIIFIRRDINGGHPVFKDKQMIAEEILRRLNSTGA